jgi:hypothetical protein
MVVTPDMFAAVDKLFERSMTASVEYVKDEFVIGYREGRDVSVIARAATWESALQQATERVRLVDQLLRNTPTPNAAVATAALVPVRFVRLRRRDLRV